MAIERSDEPTRDRLIAAAVAVFSDRGYDGARVQEIARRANLTTGAIYANFRGKADLLFDAISSLSAMELDRVIGGPSEDVPTAEVMAFLGTRLVGEPPSAGDTLLLEALVAARRDPDVDRHVRSLLAEQGEEIGRLVEQARAEGAIADEVDTAALVTFCLALALGAMLLRALDLPQPPRPPWQALIERLVAALGPG